MPSVHVQTAQNVTITYRAAGVGHRLSAYLIDSLIVYALAFFALMFAGWVSDGMDDTMGFAVMALIVVPVLLYHFLMEVFFNGQSLGKRAMKIKVVRLDGGEPTAGGYALRWVLRLVDIALTSGGVAVITIAASQHSQRLGDLAAGTTVVRLDPQGADRPYRPDLGDDYTIRFERVDRLDAKDVETLRAVLGQFREHGRTTRMLRMAERAKAVVEEKMDIAPVDLPAAQFLGQVVRDYAALEDELY